MEKMFRLLILPNNMFSFGGIQKLIPLAEQLKEMGSVIESKTSMIRIV